MEEGKYSGIVSDYNFSRNNDDFRMATCEGRFFGIKAYHKVSNEKVFFKVFHVDEEKKQNGIRELGIMNILGKGPNIVDMKRARICTSSKRYPASIAFVYEFFDKSLHCKVKSLAVRDWRDLNKHIIQQGCPPSDVRKWMGQLCEAVHWVHKCGVVHLDIQLKNIYIDASSNRIKLGCFSNAHLAKDLDTGSTTLPIGYVTSWYRPPECLVTSNPRYSFSTDIWAVGCAMGELILGDPLFPGNTEDQVLQFVEFVVCEYLPFDRYEELGFSIDHRPLRLGHRPTCCTALSDIQDRFSPLAFTFLLSTLKLDPSKRNESDSLLHDSYLHEDSLLSNGYINASPLLYNSRFGEAAVMSFV